MRRIGWIGTLGMLTLFALMSIGSGCATVGPDYEKPQTVVRREWHTELRGGLKSEAVDAMRLAEWWSSLGDPILSNLVKRAIAGGLDVRKARAKVRRSRALRNVAKAGMFPTVDALGAYTNSLGSDETGGNEAELHSVGLDAAWELDLFGGTRRSIEAAQGDLQAAEEELRDTLVTLAAEVGLCYTQARVYQARLAVAEDNIRAQRETFLLAQSRFQAGLSSELAAQQARYNLESSRSEVPALRAGLEDSLNSLAVLLGAQPGTLHADMGDAGRIPAPPPEVAVGVPADILRQRPDVRRAERELAAQTARVGVATAELYPKLTLNGVIGLDALSIGNLFAPGSRTFSLGPSLSIPVFNAGSIRSNIEAQSALQEQALVAYEASVLNALKEVENAITAYAEEQNRRRSLEAAAEAARQAAGLAESQYTAGQVDFSNVLDAQRSLLSFQDQLAQSEGAVTCDLIRLYKALGGGWTPLAQGDGRG